MGFSTLRAGMIGALMIVAVLLPSRAPLLTLAHGQGGGRPTSTPPKKTTAPPKKTTAPPKRTTRKSSPPAVPRTTPTQTVTPSTTASQQPRRVERPTQAQSFSENLGGVKLEMVLIPAGTFVMGSPAGEGSNDEKPQHRVSVPQFYMGKYEVTQAQWQAVMGTNPSSFKGDSRPVENVSWNDAQEFCRKLSQMTRREYRLPTEAEWEYAARAGTTTPFAFGSSLSSKQANFDGNSPYGGAAKGVYRQQTTPVGSFSANKFGLYDMHGNVWEWCQEWYHKDYSGAPTDGSAWESGGEQKHRVMRGGSWASDAWFCRSAYRGLPLPNYRDNNLGLRVVAVARSS